jgi:ABC-type glycerol-3-phosphate transport system substrate-binding protein
MSDPDDGAGGSPSVSRRQVLRAVGTTGAVVGGGLAGCLARGETPPGTVEIAANTDVKNNLDEIQSKLYEVGLSKDVEITAIAGSASTGARKQQYNRWLSANLEQPSLFLMDSGWTIPFIVRNQLANVSELRPRLAKTIQDEYFDTFVQSLEDRSGDVYGVPLFPTTGAMLYRKDLVKEAGFSPEKEEWATTPMSWKKFAKVTKQTREQTGTTYGFTFQAKAYEGLSCCDFKEFAGTWGGSYFGAKKNLFGPVNERPVTVDSDPVLKATRMVRSFIHGTDAPNTLDSMAGPISPRSVLQWTEEPSRKPFSQGNAVMHRNWPYAIAIDGAEESFGERLGVMPIPYGVQAKDAKFEGYGGTTSALGGWHICLNPNAQNKAQALEVMEALVDPEFQLFLFELLGWLPPRPELFGSKRARKVPTVGRYLDTLKLTVENSVPRPVTVAWPQESTKIAQKASAAFSGDASPTQAMNTLAKQLEIIEEASDRKKASAGREASSRDGATGGGQ